MKNKKPKHLLVLVILGFILLAVAIALIVLSVTVLKLDGHAPHPALLTPGMLLALGSLFMIIFGFSADITKMNAKTVKYIQEQNKEDFQDIAENQAEIYDKAITKVAHSVKKGLQENSTYCKHCGAEIDSDSKFCNKCGKKL